MKQLEFNFEALPEVVKESKIIRENRLSYAEVRECWEKEKDYCQGGRGYWLAEQMLRWVRAEEKRRREMEALECYLMARR